MNSHTKIIENKTLSQIDEVEKFMQRDVRKINIADHIRLSRYLFSELLKIRVLVLYSCTWFFAQNIGILNLIQSGYVVCAFYQQFLIGSLRMSKKHGTLEGYGFKKARPIDDGRLWKHIERKEENVVKRQFSSFLKKCFPSYHDRKQFVS